MEEIKIRKAKVSDVDTLLKIGNKIEEFEVDEEQNSFWTKEQLTNWVKSKNDVILIAESDKEIVGFVTFALHIPTGKVTWENAWINPNLRGKNIVGKLYKKAEKELKDKGAKYICGMTKPTSKASIKMQEKLGFEQGLKFIWMWKFLK
ncbi:MAG: GNAT family N-acetyltransferase [Candidatus Pacearchaeota archaeon]|jgi:L-amino acid N-acyltransferase YncA